MSIRRFFPAFVCVSMALGACSSDDDPDAHGTFQCCTLRKICLHCSCSDAEEKTGLEDKYEACRLVLQDSWKKGCLAYSRDEAEQDCR